MPATADDIAQLKSLEDRRYAAMLAGDADGIADLLHDELIYMHSIGGADSKDSYLRTLRDGSMVYRTIERADVMAHAHGDIGLVFCHLRADVEVRGVARRLDNRLLAVWSRDDGTWRLLGLQSGAIPPPPA